MSFWCIFGVLGGILVSFWCFYVVFACVVSSDEKSAKKCRFGDQNLQDLLSIWGLKSTKNERKICDDFQVDFWMAFLRFWEDFGVENGANNDTFSLIFGKSSFFKNRCFV